MFNYWKFVNIYHNFKSNLLWRHISSIGKCLPSDMQTNKYFSPRFFRIRENEEKKHLSKELLSCENSSVVFWQNEQKKKKWKKERKIPKQNLWILIDMKKTKTCSKTRKKQATMIHNCVANKFFCILFSFKKMTPPWQFYLDHCDK